MQNSRNILLSQISTEISRINKCQERDKETLQALMRMNLSLDILNKKKEDIERNMKRRENEIAILNKKEIDIRSGNYDSDIQKEAEKNAIAAKKRNTDGMKDKKRNAEIKKKNLDSIFQKEYKQRDKQYDKDCEYGYKQYMKAVETLPDYMAENLRQMSNNKGYIWRGCWFLGYKKREYNQPVILFEKIKGNITRIHEIYRDEHRVYEKYGKEEKRLIERTARKSKLKKK